jgi:membrane protease YdiL (CAAX protease family)
MRTLAWVASLLGIASAAAGWHLVARGRDVWRTMPPVFALLGLVAVWLAPPLDAPAAAAGGAMSSLADVAFGLASGAALFVATRVFVAIAVRAPAFARHVVSAYGRADSVSPTTAIALSVFVTAVGEELFWRGLVYRVGTDAFTSIGIVAAGCWLLYVAANLPSRLLPIIAAAVVGGALWTALAWWTGGVLAPIASHMLWTGLMLGFPPGPPRAEVM